jgi:hypothetical protein
VQPQQRKFSNIQAALIGAVSASAAVAANRILDPGPYDPNSVAYWGGVIIGGAIFGIAINAIIARFRR